MGKETIKIFDFISDIIKTGNYDIDIPEGTTYNSYECPDGVKYPESISFSPATGKKIKNIEYTRNACYKISTIKEIIFRLQDKCPENLNYEFIECIEKKQDDSNRFSKHFIFRRISDDKYFYYQMRDIIPNSKFLHETEKIVIQQWDFEKNY